MICYDIFDLADFPIIITDRKFVIKHKNTMAAPFFSNFRKGSKITRHTSCLDENTDISKFCEIEFTTGTQYKRALVFSHNSEHIFFVFLSSLQFERNESIIERIQTTFDGNFFDFIISAYNSYLESQSLPENALPTRFLDDLLMLMKLYGDKPSFMKRDFFDIAELIKLTSERIGKSVSALGMKMPSATISNNVIGTCFCKINLSEFSFTLCKMTYLAFKFSDSKCVTLSLDKSQDGSVIVSASTLSKKALNIKKDDPFSLIKDLSELSFEIMFLKKAKAFSDSVKFKTEGERIFLEYTIKSTDKFGAFPLRSYPERFYRQKIAKIISSNTAKLKNLLSKTI